MVVASEPAAAERKPSDGQGDGGLPSAFLLRGLLDPRVSPVLGPSTRRAAADVVQVALPGAGENSRSTPRRRRQIPTPKEVPSAEDHLGRRRDRLLLQGAIEERPQGDVLEEQVSESRREEEPRQEDGTHAHPGLQLVQEPTAEGSHAADEIVSFFPQLHSSLLFCFYLFPLIIFLLHYFYYAFIILLFDNRKKTGFYNNEVSYMLFSDESEMEFIHFLEDLS